MSRLFLIDHSLKSVGTHHFDLMECLTAAAQESDFEVIAAIHQRYPSKHIDELGGGQVIRHFSETVYQGFSELAGLRKLKRSRARSPESANQPGRIRQFLNWHAVCSENRKRDRFVRKFMHECGSLFSRYELQSDDQVFFLGVSELEVIAVLNFLAGFPSTIHSQWNFLFHFNVFDGSPCTYPRQRRGMKMLTGHFMNSIRRLPYHKLRFFATTDALAEQYMQIGISRVRTFSYPVAFEIAKPNSELPTFKLVSEESDEAPYGRDHSADPNRERPLCLAIAGGIRREKGQHEAVPELLNAARAARENGTPVEIWLQRSARGSLFSRGNRAQTTAASEAGGALRLFNHPLPKREYIDFIRNSDCGVLLYDPESYRSRRAGVLGEFLAMGRPVIVSAGNWLSDQLEACHSAHARQLLKQYETVETLDMNQVRFHSNNVPQPGGIWSFDQERRPFVAEFSIPAEVGGIVIQFQWHFPRQVGNFSEWRLFVDDRQVSMTRVIGQIRSTSMHAFFIPLPADQAVRQARIVVTNPTSTSTNSVRGVELRFLEREAENSPLTSTGISVANTTEIGLAIDELIHQYDHYRNSAEVFAHDWRRLHSATRALADLIPGEEPRRQYA
jgi:hypothetical protein